MKFGRRLASRYCSGRLPNFLTGKRCHAAFAFVFFYVLSIWLTWPCWKLGEQVLPVPATTTAFPSATVPLFNSWTIWWNFAQLKNGFSDYWNAPIFYPAKGSFAFSEPQPATLLAAPVAWSTGSCILAYHFYLRINLALNGFAIFLFLRNLRLSAFSAVAGGIAGMLHPLVWDNVDVIQQVPLWGMVWCLGATARLMNTAELRDVAGNSENHATHTVRQASSGLWPICSIALSVLAIACISIHQLLLFSITLLPCCLLFLVLARSAKFVLRAGLAAGLSGLLLLPLILPMKQILAEQNFSRSPQSVESLSATTQAWTTTPTRSIWNIADKGKAETKQPKGAATASELALNPGWLRITLAILTAGLIVLARDRRETILLLFGLVVSSVVLSFGANLVIGKFNCWFWMTEHMPFLSLVRSVYRFGYVSQLAVILLAVIGADQLPKMVPRLPNSGILSGKFFFLLKLVFLSIIIFEVPKSDFRLISIPSQLREQSWVDYLIEHGERSPILCLPMTQGYGEFALESEARWMLYATEHGCALVNGYSGFFPETWYDHVSKFSKPLLASHDVQYLHSLGVKHIVLNTKSSHCPRIAVGPATDIFGESNQTSNIQLVFEDGAMQIWRIHSK